MIRPIRALDRFLPSTDALSLPRIGFALGLIFACGYLYRQWRSPPLGKWKIKPKMLAIEPAKRYLIEHQPFWKDLQVTTYSDKDQKALNYAMTLLRESEKLTHEFDCIYQPLHRDIAMMAHLYLRLSVSDTVAYHHRRLQLSFVIGILTLRELPEMAQKLKDRFRSAGEFLLAPDFYMRQTLTFFLDAYEAAEQFSVGFIHPRHNQQEWSELHLSFKCHLQAALSEKDFKKLPRTFLKRVG